MCCNFNTIEVKILNEEPKRVNMDFPTQITHPLDKEAGYMGISHQAIIKYG